MSLYKAKQFLFSATVGLFYLASLPAYAISSNASTSATVSNTNTLTFSHQVTNGSNRKLIVGIGIEEPDNTGSEVIASVTFNGIALTRAGSSVSVSGGFLQNVEVWYLDEATLPNGNHSVVITATGIVDDMSGGAILLFDASQGAPAVQTNTNLATNSISTNITTTADNSWILDFVGGGDQRSYTQGANQNEIWDRTNSSSSIAASTKVITTAGTTTITQNPNANTNRLAHVLLEIKPFAVGGGGNCVTFRDEFTMDPNERYDRQDGTALWANNWAETNDNGLPGNGDIEINGGELQLEGNGGPNMSIKRGIDLSTYDTATLTFNYRTSGTWEGNDRMYVYASPNTGDGTLLRTYSNDQAANTESIDVSAYISSTFFVRFVEGASQNNEIFHLDNVQIEACTTPDTTPPTISSTTVSCLALNQVIVTYSENVELASATNIANYSLDNGATITGASLSGNTVTLTTSVLADLTSYTLTASNVNDLAGNTIVANSTSAFAINCSNLVAHYRLDEETWNGTVGEVKDFLGTYNGTAIGLASPLYPGKVCNAAYIPHDDNDAAQYAIDTGIDINSIGTNGNTGSINFWYQSDTPWQGGGDRVLFDASNISTNPNKYFFLTIQNDGRLNFGLEDTNDGDYRFTSPQYNFTASDWVHIGVTWDLPNDLMEIYVNGVRVAFDTSNTNGSLGDMNTLYLGDNRTTYHPGGTANSASGRIDEVYIYETVINQAQMQTNMNATHTCTAIACSYRDDFTTSSFANNDGSLNWAGDWTEIDSTTGPGAGYVSISGGDLILQNNNPGQTAMGPGVERGFSLLGATDATISYTYKLTGNVDNTDEAFVRISDDNGSSWTIIDNITNKTDGTYSNSINLSTIGGITLTDQMKISLRIRSNASEYRGNGETISFLYLSVYPAGMCTPGTLNHIRIEHDGEGLTCDGEQIIVRACVDASCSAEYSNSVTATLTPDGDTVTFTGNTTGNVHQSTAGTFTLSANTISPIPTNGVRCFVGATETCDMNFVNSGFRFTDGANPPSPITIGTQIAGKASNVNPGSQTIALQAVRTDTNTGACVGAFADATDISIEMASQCNNPTTCIAASKVSITNNAITTTINNNPNTSVSSYSLVSLLFTTNSQAILNFAYPDVGRITLHARYNIPDSTGTATGDYMSGNSNSFVVKPATFVVNNILRADDTANPANTTATDTPYFVKASTDFKATIEVHDINGNITPNYGNEITAEGVLLSPALVAGLSLTNNPAIINNTIIGAEFGSTGAVNDADGVASVQNLSWPEVGIITITPAVADTNYLGAGSITGTTTGNIGRFVPHHFDTVVTDGCSATFTYSGQPFTVQTKAMNNLATPTETQNYHNGSFSKAVTLTTPSSVAGSFNTTGDIAASDFTTGAYIKTDVAYTFSNKESVPDATFTVRATDTDGVTSNDAAATEGTTDMRSGRAKLENVYGSELTPLTMPVKVEFYSDNTLIYDSSTPATIAATQADDGFILNTDDSCTTYDATAGTLANYTGNLSLGETNVIGAVAESNGLLNITFSAPGAGNEGSVNLLADNISGWLTFPWGIDCDGDSVNDTGACGTASFGLYRGDDRIIYWREVF